MDDVRILNGRFDGRVGFVTGAGSGIGEATAKRLAAEGGRVAALDRDAAGVERVVSEIEAAGGEAIAFNVDVTSADAVAEAVESTRERWGRIDVLVNNAGISQRPVEPVMDVTEENFRQILEVNVWGVFVCTRAISPLMVEQGYGRIVHVGSRAHLGEPRMAIYSASKAALTGFTNSLALELGPYGITVNVVAPGGTPTPLNLSHPDYPVRRARLVAAVPLGRPGTTADMASAILYLGSEEAGYITSEVLHVTGGRYRTTSPYGTGKSS